MNKYVAFVKILRNFLRAIEEGRDVRISAMLGGIVTDYNPAFVFECSLFNEDSCLLIERDAGKEMYYVYFETVIDTYKINVGFTSLNPTLLNLCNSLWFYVHYDNLDAEAVKDIEKCF